MYTFNDPMVALMLRFISYDQKKIAYCNDEFIQKQLKVIQDHISEFPVDEQELRAIEWIEKYAREYRKMWEEEILTKEFVGQRCPDCPLSESNALGYCHIHDEWLKLLRDYAADEIDSKEYVQQALKLLTGHKESLKIKLEEIRKERQN